MYYTVYKTTNLINGKIYIGCHQTDDLNDDYLGSGFLLGRAIEKYGRENFKKKILHICESIEDMFKMESILVNEEFLNRTDVYNIKKGGDGGWDHTKGTISVRDKDGNTFKTSISDPRYLSGELVPANKGHLTTKDKNGNIFYVQTDDPRYINGELVALIGLGKKGYVTVYDKNGITSSVNVKDPRYLNGELKSLWTGKKHSIEARKKMSIKASIRQKGITHSQYGTCWIHNDKESIRINKNQLEDHLNNGWIKGRIQGPCQKLKDRYKNKENHPGFGRVYVYNDLLKQNSRPKIKDLNKYLKEGWKLGSKYPEHKYSKQETKVII